MAILKDAIDKKGIFTDGDWILSKNMQSDGNIGVIQLKHIGVGEFLRKDFNFISNKTFQQLKCTEVFPGDVLISRMADPIARACIVPKLPFRLVTAVDIAIMRVDEKRANAKYIQYLCNSSIVKDQAEELGRGTTRLRITRKTLEKIEIPLPSLEEQKRITAVLTRADRLRQLRRYALQLSDTYLQSVFLQMFGDPVTNPMGLPIVKFGDVCESRLGKMLDQKQQTGRHPRPYLRNVNVQWGRMNLSGLQTMDFNEKDRKRFRLRKGDVLICEGGEVGRSAIWNDELEECYYQKALHRARPNPKLAIPEFILWLMHSLANLGGLGDFTSQVTIAHLTGVKLKTIEFPLPPISQQQKFAKIYTQFEQLRAQQREAARQTDHLFDTLLHRAFRGELCPQ